MNQQTTAPAGPDEQAATPAETPLPKRARRKTPPSAKPLARNAAAPQVASPQLITKKDDRCRHYTANGRRCRLDVLDPASGLCFRHVGLQFHPYDEDLSPAFTGLLSGFESPSRIHAFLTQRTVLLVQNRISTRRASILAYLGQILLRTLPAIEQELEPEDQIIFDLPRPKRDDVVSPERAFVNRMAERCARAATPVAPDSYDGWTPSMDESK